LNIEQDAGVYAKACENVDLIMADYNRIGQANLDGWVGLNKNKKEAVHGFD
jgi:hypothetical protein